MAASRKPNELYLTRVFEAPVKLVWDAWTDPKQVAQWWGPRGFTLTTHSKDLRPGGKWRYVGRMGPEEFAFYGEFLEIVPHEKIVQTETFAPFPDGASTNTMTLTERDGRTLLRTLVQHQTAEARDMHINSGMETGMQTAFDLLEQVALTLA